MEREYLEIAHAPDVKNPKERKLYRCFEILPGTLAWGTLILAFVLSWLAPIAVAIFIILFDFFWLLRISYLSFHQIASYREMKKNLKTDWIKKLEKLNPDPRNSGGKGKMRSSSSSHTKNWHDVYHLVILPMYKEGLEVVRPTLQSLTENTYPKEKMIVALAIEERAGEVAQKVAGEIEKEFGNKFFRLLVTCHPKNIPGEIAGKGSNQSWAINQAREKIIEKLSIKPENVIVSGFDIDTKPYPQYFACLTWHYLTTEKPLRSSYQPIPTYNNNIWDAPAFSRVISSSGTFWQMMQQERPEQLITYSAHSMPFKIYLDVGYPTNIVSDDSHIYWKCFLHYDGDYRVVPLYYPVSMDAVSAKTFFRTAINQYKQQRRWAWGCVEIPYLIYGFLKNKKISLKEKIRQIFTILDGFLSWSVAALLIFFLGWLPLMIGSPEFQTTLLSYNLPRLTSNIMTVAMIGMITSATLSLLLLPPRPKRYSRWKNASFVLQWFLLPITLVVFGAFPALEAQARLMLGKYMGFWVTEKTRK